MTFKKSFTAAMMAIVMVFTIVTVSPVSAQAATSSAKASAIQTRADQQTKSVKDYAEYYGWLVTVKQYKTTGSDIRKTVKAVGAKGIFNMKQITKKVGNRFVTTWYISNNKFSLTGIKTSLKKYASSADVRAMLEDSVGIKADSLDKAAVKNGWAVTRKASYKKGVAYEALTFNNSKYKFTAKVSAQRNNGKIVYKYWRQGTSCKASAITNWLKTYSAPATK